MEQYRFYIFLISFLIGITLGTIFNTPLPVITWVCLIALGLMVASGRRNEASSTRSVVTISIALLLCALGMLRFEIASWQFGHSNLESLVGQEVSFKGKVVKEPDVRENNTQLYIKVQEELLLVSTDKYSKVQYGDVVVVRGELKKPESFTSELGRTFNYPAYLLARGVEYQVSFADVSVESTGHGLVILETLFSIKHVLMHSIESVLQEPYAGLGEGLLLGVKQAIGEDLESVFRTSGIIHIVVLSGYNVMLVVTFVLFLLSFFLARRVRIVVGLLAIVAFALLVGLSATVVRASIMASLLLIADLLGRRYDLVRALLFAATVMVFINPYLLVYDIGFQLSFIATLGLILVAPIFETFITEGFAKLSVKDFLISTIATQIAVLPLLVYHIGEVSLVAVVVNVLVLPIVPLAMLLTFFSGIVAFVSVPVALPISFLAYLSLRYIIEVATFFAALPLASIIIPPISAGFAVLMYVVLGYVVFRSKQNNVADDEYRDWVIEDESEIKGKTGEGQSPSPVQSDVPVFFR